MGGVLVVCLGALPSSTLSTLSSFLPLNLYMLALSYIMMPLCAYSCIQLLKKCHKRHPSQIAPGPFAGGIHEGVKDILQRVTDTLDFQVLFRDLFMRGYIFLMRERLFTLAFRTAAREAGVHEG
jgi:hypothetical protein